MKNDKHFQHLSSLNGPAKEFRLEDLALKYGAAACGIIPAQKLEEHRRFLEAVKNIPADLAYLEKDPAVRASVKNWFGPARSVLVCAFQYWHSGLNYDEALKKTGKGGGKTARYALVPDYHRVIKKKLKEISAEIQKIRLDADGKIFVDTSPVMEKELGRLAGLGFRGKNTLLISEELGSYFFIGGLALNFEVEPSPVRVSDVKCGACRRCIDACPAGALSEPGVLNPSLCISYWTLESKTEMPEALRSKTGGFTHGCDLCQESCPYNKTTADKVLNDFREN